MIRVATVIRLRPDKEPEYRDLHAAGRPAAPDALHPRDGMLTEAGHGQRSVEHLAAYGGTAIRWHGLTLGSGADA
ncbi:hypothetical protein ACFLIM_46755 [Nonomuraea sp. M3C6]|uniref:Uncharacterized protein n=1 Tax=Nonomuraea marmarensis TaxID=3351344 RepID=A0ABW7ATD7_9ACTN